MLRMKARIINYSYRKNFPTCLGNIFLPPQKPIILENAQAIKELGNFPSVQIEVLEPEETVDYASFPINQLRKIATKVGIKGAFFMKKAELVKILGGQHV